jgi:hypothetical protein
VFLCIGLLLSLGFSRLSFKLEFLCSAQEVICLAFLYNRILLRLYTRHGFKKLGLRLPLTFRFLENYLRGLFGGGCRFG